MSNTANQDARKLRGAEKAKRCAELRIAGKTLQEIADELGYAHRSSVRKALDAYRAECPREAVEELREMDLERSENAYKHAREAADELTGDDRVDAEVKVSRIVKNHAEIGGVIRQAPPAVVQVTQTNAGWDPSVYTPDELAALLKLVAKQHAAGEKGDAKP